MNAHLDDSRRANKHGSCVRARPLLAQTCQCLFLSFFLFFLALNYYGMQRQFVTLLDLCVSAKCSGNATISCLLQLGIETWMLGNWRPRSAIYWAWRLIEGTSEGCWGLLTWNRKLASSLNNQDKFHNILMMDVHCLYYMFMMKSGLRSNHLLKELKRRTTRLDSENWCFQLSSHFF